MRSQAVRVEVLLIAAMLCLGALLRCLQMEFETVEHFDEGVYSSVLWYDGVFGRSWPGREYFAPPGLPTLIELASLLPGMQRLAPFLPSLVFGTLTPLVFWWTARFWFGTAAGLFVLVISTCSEFHVTYSRMALTDVPVLVLVIASVALGSLSIHRNSLKAACVAGGLCGLAWWIKYTGWLPLAILTSGSLSWWIADGRRTLRGRRLFQLLGLMALSAGIIFLPCWWSLQSIGGYSAVAANHAGYLTSWQQWSNHLSEQLAFQMQMDGLWGAGSVVAGITLAAFAAALSRQRFTWNASSAFKPLLLRAIPAGICLGLLCLRVRTPIMLGCIAVGGLSGMYLQPVFRASDKQSRAAGRLWSAVSPGEAFPLGFWLSLAWVTGLLIATPFYQPYSRLMLPLLAGVWLSAAGGISWWLDAQLVAFSQPQPTSRLPRAVQLGRRLLIAGLLVAAFASSMLVPDGDGNAGFVTLADVSGNPIHQDRSDIRRAAFEIAKQCVWHLGGKRRPKSAMEAETVFTPSLLLDRRDTEELDSEVLPTAAELQSLHAVLYVYGEPAIAFHLQSLGLTAVPVAHIGVDAIADETAVFLIFGPNAKRTPGIWEQWQSLEARFEWVDDVFYRPGPVTLTDLFSAKYLSTHSEALQQRFEVYRVRNASSVAP